MTSPIASFPVPDLDDSVQIKDFTIKKKRIPFKIDDDIFHASAILGLPMMQDMVKLSKNISKMIDNENYESIFEIFDQLLIEESAKVFRERAMSKGDRGIDVQRQLMPILYYLLEQYGVRPTQPSSDSSSGSLNVTDGITSTAGAPTEASILPN